MGAKVGLLAGGAVLGFLLIGAFRFATLPEPASTEGPHFHANFAVFINGERLDLSGEKYMEDITTCQASTDVVLARERTHMHERIGDVVHVHDLGVTWGHFFTNIGFALGDDFLVTDEGEMIRSTPEAPMKWVLNGRQVQPMANELIVSLDRLLISIGPESVDEVIETQFSQIASTAQVFNDYHQDAGGCSSQPVEPETRGERLKRAFWR